MWPRTTTKGNKPVIYWWPKIMDSLDSPYSILVIPKNTFLAPEMGRCRLHDCLKKQYVWTLRAALLGDQLPSDVLKALLQGREEPPNNAGSQVWGILHGPTSYWTQRRRTHTVTNTNTQIHDNKNTLNSGFRWSLLYCHQGQADQPSHHVRENEHHGRHLAGTYSVCPPSPHFKLGYQTSLSPIFWGELLNTPRIRCRTFQNATRKLQEEQWK